MTEMYQMKTCSFFMGIILNHIALVINYEGQI
jgi:hypothetical protein